MRRNQFRYYNIIIFLCAFLLGTLLLWAAQERMAPDAILAQAGFTPACTLPNIDEDPDVDDGAWCTASSNNVNVAVRVSFPTPVAPPTNGVDLQNFRFLVRRTAGSGTVDPTARVELWENGALVRAGAENTVTSDTGQVFQFTWDSAELATNDGSLVECKIVGTKSGASPAKRSAVDIGAVEWNAETSPVPTADSLMAIQ